MKVSFGMRAQACIPWIAFVAPEMQVSKGLYPVCLCYKELDILVLTYGISGTEKFTGFFTLAKKHAPSPIVQLVSWRR